MEVPTVQKLPSFGTIAPDIIAIHNSSGNKVYNDKQSAIKEISKREGKGNGDKLIKINNSICQWSINHSLDMKLIYCLSTMMGWGGYIQCVFPKESVIHSE